MKHRYRVTLTPLGGQEHADGAPLQFEVENHDDIIAIVKRLEQRPDFAENDAKAFGVGLKLFSEVMIKNKQAPLFADFLPHFVNFMKELKKGQAVSQ